MANEPVDMRISQLDAAVSVADTDEFPATKGALTKKYAASLVKAYMNGTNDISALGDGSVTGAILNVKSTSETADSNIAETMAENGAHNLLCHDLASEVRSGVTMTVNADRSITLSNSNTSGNTILFITSFLINLEAGKTYKALLDSATGVMPLIYTETTEQYYSSGATITASVTERAKFILRIEDDFTTSSPVTIKPMLVLASDPSTDYEPYAMTNRELTERVATKTLINDTTIKFYATGNVRTLHLLGTGIGTSDNWASMLGSENLPKNTIYAPCFVSGQNTPCCIYLATNGDIKLMDYQGAPFSSAGTADVTLTWCV